MNKTPPHNRPNLENLQVSNRDSALVRYRTVAVGRQGTYTALLLFELITTCILPLPGGLGRWARNLLLPLAGVSIGNKVRIGRDCTVRNPAAIQIGDGAVIEDRVCLDVKPDAERLIIGSDVFLGRGTICNCAGAILEIGDGSRIAASCRLGSKLGLRIGRNCRIGVEACCSGAAHAYDDRSIPIALQPVTCKGPTVIGDNVVIGDRATLLDGVKIGANAHIAADTLVISDIPENTTVAGVPGRIRGHAE